MNSSNTEWCRSETKIFWNDIATDNHIVQIYDDDSILLNTLTNYVIEGFNADNCAIVIATPSHLNILNTRLVKYGFDLNRLMATDDYIPLNAVETLSKFMVDGYPDEKYFMETVGPIMKRANKNGRQVRAFGEMVALLWEHGNSSATLQLEHLWNKFCETESFCLFCAYPKSGFSNDSSAAIMHICSAHSKLIEADEKFPSEILYKNVV